MMQSIHTPISMFSHPCMRELLLFQTLGCSFFFFSDLDVGACIFQENVPIDTFNISFGSTPNKQQYATKITCTKVKKRFIVSRNLGFF